MKKDVIYAAGAVLWKVVDKELKVLIVHRTQHKDVSIPKGKVDPGETLPETAVREIKEETGLDIALGPYLHRWLNLPIARAPMPALSAWYARLLERPGDATHCAGPMS
jgi:8-oxo-dGTP pyrophosphatase MutT (NUDIX family)